MGSLSDLDPVETSENHKKHVCASMLLFSLILKGFRKGLDRARSHGNSIRVDIAIADLAQFF